MMPTQPQNTAANPNIALFMRMMQAKGMNIPQPNLQQPQPQQPPQPAGGQPQRPMMPPPQGMPQQGQQASQPTQQMPQGSPPPGAPQASPPATPGGIPPQLMQMVEPLIQKAHQDGMQQGYQLGMKQAPQQLASQGVNGDTMIAHLTPGEMTVPPEVQTPKVLATLKKAYETKKVEPQQFTAGSPQSSVNPKTGLPQYNFMSAFLPAALGVAGVAAAPFTGGTSLGLSEAATAALMGGAGSALGTALTGGTPLQDAISGIGAGAGGYFMSGLGGAAGSATGNSGGSTLGQAGTDALANGQGPTIANLTAAQNSNAAQNFANSFGGTSPFTPNPGSTAASAINSSLTPPSNSGFSFMGQQENPMAMIGAGAGSYLGGALSGVGQPAAPTGPQLPAGYNTPLTPVSQLPSAQTLLGENSYKGPVANFNGYNPATNYPASYNFFPTATNGQ